MLAATVDDVVRQYEEVANVLGYDRPLLTLGYIEDQRVSTPSQVLAGGHCVDVVPQTPQLFGNHRGPHPVKQ
jgi:hypothetical protein